MNTRWMDELRWMDIGYVGIFPHLCGDLNSGMFIVYNKLVLRLNSKRFFAKK